MPSFSWGLTLKNGKIVDENKPIEFTENKNSEKIALETLTINKFNNNGTHYSPEFKIKGKYVLPLKSIVTKNPQGGADKHEWRARLDSFMTNFYALGDFNNDGIQDFICDGGFFQPTDGFVYVNSGDGTYTVASEQLIKKYVSSF